MSIPLDDWIENMMDRAYLRDQVKTHINVLGEELPEDAKISLLRMIMISIRNFEAEVMKRPTPEIEELIKKIEEEKNRPKTQKPFRVCDE